MAQRARDFPGPRRGYDPATGREIFTDPSVRPAPAPPEAQWSSGINLLLGLWLIVAPWVLNYSGQNNAVWNEVIVGAAIALIAFARVSAPESWAPISWVNVILGGWMIIAPFVLTYGTVGDTSAIYWNDIIVGTAVVILALVSSTGSRRNTAAPTRL